MFDLDGTLADTGRDLADAVNFTRARFGLAPWAQRAVLAHVGRGVEHLIRHAIPEESSRRFAELSRTFLERYENHLLDATALYPDVQETLDHFQGKRRAVISNKIHRLAVAVLRGLGVEHCFDMILGGDSGLHKKPHPALLKQALAGFGVQPQRAVMIGDGRIDIDAGKQAGVITCAVTYGFGREEDIAVAEPDLVVRRLSDLPRYLC
jgi:phosphoglycolate phosphatase